MKDLFRNKNYSLLFMGSLVSEMGNVLFGFVAGLYVQDLMRDHPRSGLYLALFLALGAAVRLAVSPLAGVLVDRWNKVRIIYLTDFIRGALFLVTAYVFFGDLSVSESINILLLVTVISGVISAFFGPAVTSATPEIVGLAKVQQANGANSIIQSSTMILGVIMGAAAFGWFTFPIAILINAISFIVSGITEMFIRSEHKDEIIHDDKPKSMTKDFIIGFTYLKKKEGLLRMMIYSLFLNFAFAPFFSVGIPYLFRTELERNAWEIAWPNIVFGLAMMISGIIIGGMIIKNMTNMIRRNLVFLSLSFISMTVLVYLLSTDVIEYWTFYGLLMANNVLVAIFMMSTNVPLNTGMIKVIDPELRGRVFSTIGAISGGAVPVSIVLGGLLIDLTSVAFLGVVCSVILLFPAAGFLFDGKVRRLLQGIEEETENGGLQEAV